MPKAEYNPPGVLEGTVVLTMTESDAAKLRALIGRTNSNHFNGIYKALDDLKIMRYCMVGLKSIDLINVSFMGEPYATQP